MPNIFRHRLSSILTASLLGLTLHGAVALADVVVTPEELAKRVKEHIVESTTLEQEDAKLFVDIVKLPNAPIVLKGEEVRFSMEDSRSNQFVFRTIVQVTLSTEDETRHLGVPVRLSLEKPVWVSKKMVRAREPITKNDVMVQRKRLDHEAPYAISAKEDIAQYTSKINLPAGSILDLRQVSVTPAVYRNDDIRMIMEMSNGVSVTVMGKALEDGAVGRRIRVYRQLEDYKRKIYNAEVVNKNTVLVRL